MDREFFIACGDTAKPLQTADAPLDDVSTFVCFLVESLASAVFVGAIGDDWRDVVFAQPIANPVRRESSVARHLIRPGRPRGDFLHQRRKALRLVFLTGTDGHRQRRPGGIANQVQLGAETALAAA